MALNIIHTIECHCGADAESTMTYLDFNPREPLVIGAELALCQTDFECPECGCVTGTGYIDTKIASSGAECAAGDDDG